jgi:hypothetical protein
MNAVALAEGLFFPLGFAVWARIFGFNLFDVGFRQIKNITRRLRKLLVRGGGWFGRHVFLCHRNEYNKNPLTRTAAYFDTRTAPHLHTAKTPPIATVCVRARGRRFVFFSLASNTKLVLRILLRCADECLVCQPLPFDRISNQIESTGVIHFSVVNRNASESR